MNYKEKRKLAKIAEAADMLAQGRDPSFVKKITTVSIIDMIRFKLLTEVVIPNPRVEGEVIKTGVYRYAG